MKTGHTHRRRRSLFGLMRRRRRRPTRPDNRRPLAVEPLESRLLLSTISAPLDVDFNDYPIDSYGGSAQDKSGVAAVEDGGATLYMAGNRWKSIELDYDVTRDTVLEFDFTSTRQGEIHAIGFDTDLQLSSGRAFQLYGTQSWGNDHYHNYVGTAPGVQHYRIPVGRYFTGRMRYLFFANDHDVVSPTAQSVFSRVQIYQAQAPPAIDFGSVSMGSYGGRLQDATGSVTVDNGGNALHMVGNRWQAVELDYYVTPETLLEFDFQSTRQGEIHAVGLDTDLQLSSDQAFQLHGTQTWGSGEYHDYAANPQIRSWRQYPALGKINGSWWETCCGSTGSCGCTTRHPTVPATGPRNWGWPTRPTA